MCTLLKKDYSLKHPSTQLPRCTLVVDVPGHYRADHLVSISFSGHVTFSTFRLSVLQFIRQHVFCSMWF